MLLLSGIAQADWALDPNEPADPFTEANCSSNIAAGDKNNSFELADPVGKVVAAPATSPGCTAAFRCRRPDSRRFTAAHTER